MPAQVAQKKTLQDILANEDEHDRLVQVAKDRHRQSADFCQPWFEKFVRFFKIYRSLVDEVENSDEPNTTIAYAYGMVEDMVSRIAEPILQLRPPCRVQAKRAGQEKSADNFSTITSNYFQSSRYQLEKTQAIRSFIICGNDWEQDCWLNEFVEGRKWAKVPRKGLMSKIKGVIGDALGRGEENLPKPVEYDYSSLEEVQAEYPHRVGYHTDFPSIFDVFPEPKIRNVRDMHWLLRQQKSVTIKDLERQRHRDPITKQLIPNFDFSKMREDEISNGGTIAPQGFESETDYGEEMELALSGRNEATADRDTPSEEVPPAEKLDQVHLMWVFEPRRIYVVANARWVVFYQEDVFHVPRIPFRLKCYTPQKEFLFAMGMLEPIENMIYELWDIHKLSMQNWVRSVHQLVAYNEDAVPYPDDFKPRAGGRVRVRTGTSVHHEITHISANDVTPSMLAQESNTKGLLERAVAISDFSPGVEGTKQHHKTLGGLMEIARQLAQRTTTIRRMVLADYQDQMWFMEKLYSQFQFQKQSFAIYGPDGSSSLMDLDMWDIHTDGVGFDFVIEYDPSFGDDALMRNQMMVLGNVAINYNSAVLKMGLEKTALVDLEDIMRRTLKAFGWADTSKVLAKRDGATDADDEFQMMMQGIPVAPKPGEDLISHLIDHTMQAMSPVYAKNREEGKVSEESHFLLTQHLRATKMLIDRVSMDPAAAAQAKLAVNVKKEIAAGRYKDLPQNSSQETAPAAAMPGSGAEGGAA